MRLLAQAESTACAEMDEIIRISRDLLEQRPNWDFAHRLSGDLELHFGRVNPAIAAYQRAWLVGNPSLYLAIRLVDLLSEQGRVDDAGYYIDQARDYLKRSPQLLDRAIPWYLRRGEMQRILQLASSWVEQRPDDAMANVRLGRIYQILASTDSGDAELYRAEAEKQFREAVRKAPQDVRSWIAWLSHHAEPASSPQRARDVVAAFAAEVEFPEAEKAFVLAQFYQLSGDSLQAGLQFRRAVELCEQNSDPEAQVRVLTRAAAFFAPTVPAVARLYGERALEIDPAAISARDVLSRLTASAQTPPDLDEAIAALQDPEPGNAGEAVRITKSLLLARRNQPGDLEEAIALLESIPRPRRDTLLQLARLYETSGRIAPAWQVLSDLSSAAEPRPGDLHETLRFWTAHFAAEEAFAARAERVFQVLGTLPGQSVHLLRWRIRQYAAMESLGTGGDPDADFYQRLKPHLEAVWREHVGASGPGMGVALRHVIDALLEENQHRLLPLLMNDLPNGITPSAAMVRLAHAQIAGHLEPAAQQAVQQLLNAYLDTHPQDLDVLQAYADALYIQGAYEAAAGGYRRILAQEPERRSTLINLALTLAEVDDGREEALGLIEAEAEQDPADSELNRARAAVLAANGRHQQALDLLDGAVASRQLDASLQLQRAVSYEALGNHELARNALIGALCLNIEAAALSPDDRSRLETLRKEYGLQWPGNP